MNVVAEAKTVRISPRKAGLVAGLIRGRSVADALVILDHTPKKAAKIIDKVVKSARANAINNLGLKEDTLTIDQLSVGHGPRYRRYRPAFGGRARPYVHRTSHIRVVVAGSKPEPKKTDKPKAAVKNSKEKK